MAPRYQIKPQHEESGLYIFVLKRLVSKACWPWSCPGCLSVQVWHGGEGWARSGSLIQILKATGTQDAEFTLTWSSTDLPKKKKKRCAQRSLLNPNTASQTEHPIYPNLHIPSMHLRGRIRWGCKFGLLSQKDPGLLLTGFVTFEKLLKPFKSQVPHL